MLWQSLIATVNEQAKALQRAAFSPIVREAGDLANAVFDRRGRMVAQAVTGTPGHINSLAVGAAAILEEYPPDTLDAGRRADHQRPVQDRRPAARRHGARPRVQRRAGRSPSSARPSTTPTSAATASAPAPATCSKRACGSRSASCMMRGRAQPRRVEVHPLQRAPARPHGRRPARPDGLGRGRRAAAPGAVRQPRPRRHRGPGRRDHRAARRRRPGRAIRALPGGHLPVAASMLDLADGSRDRHRRARSPSTPRPGEILVDYAGSSGRQPVRHQRRQELHPRLHDVHRAQRAQPRDARTTTAAWRRSRSRRPRAASSTRCRPQPCTARHVVGMFLPNAAPEGARPGQARPGHGRGLRRGVDDAGERATTTTAARSSRRCSPTPAGSAPGPTKPGLSACSYPTGVAAVPVEVVEAIGTDPLPPQGAARRDRAAPARSPAGSARRSSSRVDTTRPWQLNAVTSRLAGAAGGDLRRRAGRGRLASRSTANR